MDKELLNKFPKKHQKYIKDIYKENGRYSLVIIFDDNFTRSIGDWNFSDIKWYAKQIIEIDRNITY